jgi:OOP family OmpA-OmpF porin
MKKSAVLAAALGVALLATAPAQAQDRPWDDEVGQWFLVPFVGGTWVDDDRQLDDDMHYGVGVGKHMTDEWSAQFSLYTSEHDANRASRPWPASFDGEITGGTLDLMRVFYRSGRISPYLLGGIGYQTTDYEGLEHDDNVAASIGAGLMWDLFRSSDCSRTVQLRPEIRARYDLASGNTLNDFLGQVGLAFGWGGSCPAPEPVAAEPPPPPPPPPPAACPDSDGDGVCDADDKCPNTPAGTQVDKAGCPMIQTLKVLFDFDSAELRPESITELERVVKFLNEVPFATALVEGHTDSVGTEEYNQGLSDRRAKAVFDYLSSRGVDPARLKSIGHGELKPIADNATAEGRQQNRRVMLIRTDSGM